MAAPLLKEDKAKSWTIKATGSVGFNRIKIKELIKEDLGIEISHPQRQSLKEIF